ncbi:bifunctional aminoglycoside phosphotransferase/ATP-binding protein [Nocardia salmonicida]|uniref:bifunctional aminoglycoside phosphotransferase/ATP-binding protein n=1 Tax=Nocardia salmonicida TaxID=53431 RepID=UPI000A9C7F3D|nr:AAA family ATPase [Nocardia salmonicida]
MIIPAPARVHETHSGVVLLCGDRAYKVKKALRTDFLDFSTVALREDACARELELNRRLAPDVYLGVAHLSDVGGGPAEPVLVMQRMPEDRRLSNLLTAGDEEPPVDLSALVSLLVRFHDRARRSSEIDREGSADALRARWRSLLSPLREASGELVDLPMVERIDHRVMRYLDGRTSLLDKRINDGRIVDGHGDLLAEDIFDLPDGFRVLDCLDFDDRLRYVDRCDDISFLAMDFDFLGHAELGDRLVADYLRAAGDPAPTSLRDHYIAYRATVRAKVDLIRLGQGELAAGPRLRKHLSIAARRLERATVRLTLIGGLPGTGKSTVAAELSAATGAVVFASDHVRKELARVGALNEEVGRFGAGRYCAAGRARVYDELLWRARVLLTSGVSVILDASWIDPDNRRHATQMADAVSADLVSLHCVCPTDLAHQRIGRRRTHESDATSAIADAMAATAVPWPEAVTVDTAGPLADSVAVALDAWHSGTHHTAGLELTTP